jgi:hypothetical protein
MGQYMPPDMAYGTPIPQRVTSISDGLALDGDGVMGQICVLRVGHECSVLWMMVGIVCVNMRPTSGVSSDIGYVGSGYLHVCATKQSQGTVWCWGDNRVWQLSTTIRARGRRLYHPTNCSFVGCITGLL